MRAAQSECPGPDRQRLATVLADDCTRRILGSLQSGPASPDELAASLAAAERNCRPDSVPSDDRHRYRQRFYHDYLPRLEAADLVERTADGLVKHRPVRTDRFAVSLPDLDDPEDPTWPAAAAVLAREYRYQLLSLLADADDPVPLSTLADALAAAERDATETPRTLSVALHHIDLPKLADVDLVAYDTDEQTVRATPVAHSLL